MCLNTTKASERTTHLQGIKKTARGSFVIVPKNTFPKIKKAARFATGGWLDQITVKGSDHFLPGMLPSTPLT
jgi:hypothetical protein